MLDDLFATNSIVLWLIALLLWLSGWVAAIHALLNKSHPSTALGWIGVSLLFPPIGGLLYYLFGINRVQRVAQRLDRESRHGLGGQRPGLYARVHHYPFLNPEQYDHLAAAGDRLSAWPVVPNNNVDILVNGEEAYPAMLEAIEQAEVFIYLSTYIFETNRIGRQFISSLKAAVERGVDVRVLLDGVGEYYAWPNRRPGPLLRKRGIKVGLFIPPRLVPPSVQLNLRDHRKMLIVDGQVAFTGGMNIGERHFFEQGGMRDIHFRLIGPIVSQIEAVFLSDWAFTTGQQTLVSRRKKTPQIGQVACRCIEDGPTRHTDRLTLLLISAMASAKRRVLIMTPYFLPMETLVSALQTAALRGIDVSIVLPAKNNLPYVDWASRHGLNRLLERRVKIYFQPAPFVHTKLFVVDDAYAIIGSSNLDPRSLRLNFEMGVELYDTTTVAKLADHIRQTMNNSRRYTLTEYKNRPWFIRLRDSFFWLFSSYL